MVTFGLLLGTTSFAQNTNDTRLLWQPTISSVQLATIGFLIFKDCIYTTLYHIVAWYLCDRLGNTIPDPPKLIQAIFNDA